MMSSAVVVGEKQSVTVVDKGCKVAGHGNDAKTLELPGRVLVRGPLLMSPLEKITHFAYFQELQKGIKSVGIEEFNFLQRSVIPHFLRDDDCFIVGGVSTGKSLAYLMPMVGKLLESIEEEAGTKGGNSNARSVLTETLLEKQLGRNPSAVIVCSDRNSARKIQGHLSGLLMSCNQRQVSFDLLCDIRDTKRQDGNNGADIIITTAQFLSDVLISSKTLVGFTRLRYFVFEEIDVLLRTFPKEFGNIQEAAVNVAAKHSRYHVQRVFCGLEWCSELEDLFINLVPLGSDKSPSYVPTLFINSVNQALKYSEVRFGLKHCPVNDEEKLTSLLGLLKNTEVYKHRGIIVACSTSEVAITVNKYLEDNGVSNTLVESSTMGFDAYASIRNEWENFPNKRKKLVISDDVLRHLGIHSATCLIHYDLPEKNGVYGKVRNGSERFLCMWQNFRDIAAERMEATKKLQRKELDSYFFLTGTENAVYKLAKFAEGIGCVVPDSLMKLTEEQEEEITKKLAICPGLKLYGRCTETVVSKCRYRHRFLLEELERTPVIPRSGQIEVRISECVNPSHYTGQILRYYEYREGKPHLKETWIHKCRSMAEKLDQYFMDTKNRVPPKMFTVGTVCVVEHEAEMFRARILQILTRTDSMHPKQLRVFCIDIGIYLQPHASKLFELPQELSLDVCHQLAVEIVLANLQPPDNDNGYESKLTAKARDITVDKILNGGVKFSLGETVWINPLVDFSPYDISNDKYHTFKTRWSVRSHFTKSRIAENNEGHISRLVDLWKKTGFACPELLEEKQNLLQNGKFMSQFWSMGDDYNWAFATTSSMEKPERVVIWTSYVKDAHNIFGNLDKFCDILNDLSDCLNDEISEMLCDKCPTSTCRTQFAEMYETGLVVAVKDREGDEWRRGLIVNVREEENPVTYDVFFVDMGDVQLQSTCDDLFPIPKTFVTRLPFQAIAFELTHVEPLEGGRWGEGAYNKLLEMTLTPEDNDTVMMDVVPIQSIKDPKVPCRKYSSFMYLESGAEIGENLVCQNVARFKREDGNAEVEMVRRKLLTQFNIQYAKQLADEDSDDAGFDCDDEGDNEHEFEVVGFNDKRDAMKVLGIEPAPQVPTKKPSTATAPSTTTIQNHTSSAISSGMNEQGPSTIRTKDLGGASPNQTGVKYPTVYWKQNRFKFVLRVDLPDIKDYTITVNKKVVSFLTKEPPGYGFSIQCFGTIEDKPAVFLSGQYSKITIEKRCKWDWPRPLVNIQKYRWFKEDVDFSKISDDEDQVGPRGILVPPEEADDDSASASSLSDQEEPFLTDIM